MADQYNKKSKFNKNIKNPESPLFKSLTKLFSGPLVNFRQQAQIRFRRRDLNKFNFNSATGKQFQRTSYNPFDSIQANIMANQTRAERYSDFDQMEYCLHGDTKIAVPGGYKTLKELAEQYGLEKEFIIYSYDHNKNELVPAIGKQARKTRTDHAWKVTFENGQSIIGTNDHRLMMRDGTYKNIGELRSGDAMMPFYRKDLINSQKDEGDGYRWIYTMHNDENRKKGWIAEHILIAEWIEGRRLKENEVVHHKNFIKHDNNPENLVIMDNNEHITYHQNILNEQRKNDGWWDNFRKKHSEWMKNNNPSERKDITYEKILYLCDTHGYNQANICRLLDTDPQTIKRKLKTKGFVSFEQFAKVYNPEWKNEGQNNRGNKNPRYDKTLSFADICSAYEQGISSNELAKKLNTSYIKIANRIKANGYKNYSDFTQNYANHKVASVEYYGFIDLYDLTVDGYKNFATDTVISHNTPEIASTLDIYADEMTTHSSMSKMLHIKSANQEIRGILESLYYDILNIEFNLFGWCRTMCKFGDMFLYLEIDPELGVRNAIGLPSQEVERLEGQDKTNPNYVQFQWNSGGLTFENWQIAHFRILGQDKYSPYGTSILEPARRIWRQLNLLEDAMMAYRIVRAPDRRVFYIDVGNIAPEDIEQYMLKIQAQMKRNMIVDPSTGRVDLRYNPMSIDEDYFVPTRGTSNTKIDTLSGGNFVGDIEDVQYLRDKLFSALKIPQSYLARDAKASEDKTTLAQKDIRFARTIQRLQRVLISELEKVGIIHLFTLGYRNEDLLNFSLTLNNPSKISELQELEHWKTKFEVAGSAKEGFFSKRWIAENVFNLSEMEFKKIQREIFYDKQYEKSLEAIGAAPGAGAEGGAAGDMASALAGAGGGEETPTAAAGEAPETPEETGAVPVTELPAAKRRDDVNLADMGVSRSRDVSYSMRSDAFPEGGRRNTFRTMIPGYDKLSSLHEETTYSVDEDEKRLHEVNRDIQNLLASLEKKNAK